MKSLLVASIVLAMAGSALAQIRTQPGLDNDRNAKGGPASKESTPGAGGEQGVVKSNSGTPDARRVPTPQPPR
jgi:hypothetical protein